jgi:hypothetical protein
MSSCEKKKICIAWQTTDENMALAHCMLDTQGNKHTLTICNTASAQQQWLHERSSMLRYTYEHTYEENL